MHRYLIIFNDPCERIYLTCMFPKGRKEIPLYHHYYRHHRQPHDTHTHCATLMTMTLAIHISFYDNSK